MRYTLSDTQREALSKGRQKRWIQQQEQKKGEVHSGKMPREPPRLKKRAHLSLWMRRMKSSLMFLNCLYRDSNSKSGHFLEMTKSLKRN